MNPRVASEPEAIPAGRGARLPFGAWEWAGLGLLAALVAGGLWNVGYPLVDRARGVAWAGCGLAGAWAAVSWVRGRVRWARPFPAGWVLGWFGLTIAWGGLMLVPLPSGLVAGASPPWGQAVAAMEAAGVEPPRRVPLALAPQQSARAWHQAVAMACFFAAACVLASRRRGAAGLCLLVACSCVGLGLLGFLQVAMGGTGRARVVLVNPNHYAALVLMGLPLAVALAWRRYEVARRVEGGRTTPDKLLVVLALVGLAAAGWAMSLSRASVAAGVVVVGAWLVAEAVGRYRTARRRGPGAGAAFAWVAGATAVGGLLLLAALAGPELAERSTRSADAQVIGRSALVEASVRGLAETRMLGMGLAGTEYALNRFVQGMTTRVEPVFAHNDWVQWGCEMGLVGLVGGVLLVLGFGRSLARELRSCAEVTPWEEGIIRRAAAVGVGTALVHAGLDFHLRIPMVGMVFLLLLALTLTRGALGMAKTP